MVTANPSSFRDVPRQGGALAFAALIGANAALALGPMFVRQADVGPVAAGFWRLTLALPLLLAFAAAARTRDRVASAPWTRRAALLAIVAGIFFALDLASWHYGILRTRMANATLFGNSASLLLVIYGIILARAPPARNEAAGIVLALAGAMLLMGRSYELSPRHFVGDLFCLLAGLLYTGYLLSMQRLRGRQAIWPSLALSTAAGIVPLLLIALALGEAVLPRHWTPVLLLAFSSQIVGQGLLIYAIPQFRPLVVGLALLTQPVTGAFVGWTLFGERLEPLDFVGGAMVAVALVLVRLPGRPPSQP